MYLNIMTIVGEDDLPVRCNPGGEEDGPFALIELAGYVRITLEDTADCERLARAAETARMRLEIAQARTPHPYAQQDAAAVACGTCGLLPSNAIHGTGR